MHSDRACNLVSGRHVDERWTFSSAALLCQGTTRMERAASGRGERTGWFSVKTHALLDVVSMQSWRGRQERPCVGMVRLIHDHVGGALLDDAPEIHHGEFVRDVAHRGKVMCDQYQGQTEVALQFLEQVEDAGFDADVE